MKSIISILLSLLLFSCNSSEKKEDNSVTKESTVNTENTNSTKKSDYSSLFSNASKNCAFVSAEMLAEALKVTKNEITSGNDNCTYYYTNESTGNKTRFRFKIESWGNNKVKQGIKMAEEKAGALGKDSRTGHFKISDTGDTYLSVIHNKRICILNDAQENVITVVFTPQFDLATTPNEVRNKLRDEARDLAYAISNHLLKVHQS